MTHDTRDYSEPSPMRDEPKKHGDSLADRAVDPAATDRPADPLNGDEAGSRNGSGHSNHSEPPHPPQP